MREKRDILIKILRDNDKIPAFDEFSQGSYGMFLGNEPVDDREYDIDVGLRFNVEQCDYEPLELKNAIYEVLENHTDYGAEVKKPCVNVTYKKGGEKAFHVDLVSYAYEDKDDHESQMYLAHGKNSSSEEDVRWDKADPVALVDHIKNGIENKEDRDQFRRIVRYLKRWKNIKFNESGHSEPPSIGITLLVQNEFSPCAGDDLTALLNSVEKIINKFQFSEYGENDRALYTISCSMPCDLRFEPGNDAFEKMSKAQMTDFKDKIEKMYSDLEKVQAEVNIPA